MSSSNKRHATTLRSEQGTVLEVSRRFVTVLTVGKRVVTGTASSKSLEVVAGDEVTFEERDGEFFITDVAPSRRNLYRSSRGGVKRMGANIDALLVITAPGATFNPVVVDRMLVAARVQAIPTTLVVNKSDLGLGDVESVLAVYERAGVPVLRTSAKRGDGMDEITAVVDRIGTRVVALCGVSGVGKSTILNKLVPGAKTRTGELSERTGQGKQTTSQPRGFLHASSDARSTIIIDLPGVQFFGLSHITSSEAAAAFPELVAASARCQFGDCKHLKEPVCGVREAVERGEIATWRYDSYCQILQEIDEAKEY